MNIHITEREWSYSCGEPCCCDDYGTELTITNGDTELYHNKYGQFTPYNLFEILCKLGISCTYTSLDEESE